MTGKIDVPIDDNPIGTREIPESKIEGAQCNVEVDGVRARIEGSINRVADCNQVATKPITGIAESDRRENSSRSEVIGITRPSRTGIGEEEGIACHGQSATLPIRGHAPVAA